MYITYLTCVSHVYICLTCVPHTCIFNMYITCVYMFGICIIQPIQQRAYFCEFERILANSSAILQIQAHSCEFERILANSSAFKQIWAHFCKFERTFVNSSAFLQIRAHFCKFSPAAIPARLGSWYNDKVRITMIVRSKYDETTSWLLYSFYAANLRVSRIYTRVEV